MEKKIELINLTTGFCFPPVSYEINQDSVIAYLNAVDDKSKIYEENNCVPPMAVAALAIAAMGNQIELPAGSIHVSQEYSFNNLIRLGEHLTSYASVKRNIERSKLHILNIEIKIENEKKEVAISGETGFILPRY